MNITTHDPEQTRRLAQCLGQQIQQRMVLRLNGDLGSGKTCFAQGLARGLGVPEGYDITSPTYTLINEYPGRLPLFHIDLYRLEDGFDAEMIGLWEIFSFEAVVAVEWPERLPEDAWPENNIKIELSSIDTGQHQIKLIGYGLGTDNLILEAVKLYES